MSDARTRRTTPESSRPCTSASSGYGSSNNNNTKSSTHHRRRSIVDKGGLESDLLAMLRPPHAFADVDLRCRGAERRAHKCILVARSPVFAAMLSHDTREKQRSAIVVDDIDDPAVLDALLEYVYSGTCAALPSVAFELLRAADKYRLVQLKAACEYELFVQLSVRNATACFLLADQHSAKGLRANALQFINKHCCKVIAEPGWREIYQRRDLVQEVLELVFREKDRLERMRAQLLARGLLGQVSLSRLLPAESAAAADADDETIMPRSSSFRHRRHHFASRERISKTFTSDEDEEEDVETIDDSELSTSDADEATTTTRGKCVNEDERLVVISSEEEEDESTKDDKAAAAKLASDSDVQMA